MDDSSPEVPLDWVSDRVSATDEVRRRSVRCACDGLIAMIDRMAPGDELRTFRGNAARRGYVVLRGARVVDAFTTADGT